ncbi:MAG: peptidylprolyl isomerase [Flavobacteriales bacterium]|nr:peptidylprolyl isomerase [Flavobacteriales bacterium]
MRSPLLLIVGLLTCVILGSASGCNDGTSSTENEVDSAVNVTGNESDMTGGDEQAPDATMEKKRPQVKIMTEYGDMIIELYNETPKHRDNFLKLVEDGFYNDLLFHRVMNEFMIQGGDPDSRGAAPNVQLGRGGPGYTVEAEFNDQFAHVKGALAAARQPDQVNPQKASSGSQFYIVHGKPQIPQEMLMQMENRFNMRRDSTNQFRYSDDIIKAYTENGGYPYLDQEYTVFGQVIEGLSVIDSIAVVKTDRANRPFEDVKMTMEIFK